MPTTEAQIQANRQNALKSSGPRTLEGKETSRANALKHGMTGAGIVLAEVDAVEIKRRSGTFARELNAVGDLQVSIAHRAAINSVRMERGADQQIASQIEQIRQLEADFLAPEDLSEEDADRLRSEAIRRAMFDTSKQAILARRHEAACERGFYRALKELRQIQAQVKAQPDFQPEPYLQPEFPASSEVANPSQETEKLASFLPEELDETTDDPEFLEYLKMVKECPLKALEWLLSATPKPEDRLSFAVGQSR